MFSGKLNKLRSYAMLILILGVGVMYLAILAKPYPILMAIFMVIGFLIVIFAASSYFWTGLLSNKATLVECPSCGKVTKMLGKSDECMFCKQKISLDPKYKVERMNKDQ